MMKQAGRKSGLFNDKARQSLLSARRQNLTGALAVFNSDKNTERLPGKDAFLCPPATESIRNCALDAGRFESSGCELRLVQEVKPRSFDDVIHDSFGYLDRAL